MNMPLAVGGVFFLLAAGMGGAFLFAARAMDNHDEGGPRRRTAMWTFLAFAAFMSGVVATAWWVDTWGTDDRPCAEYSYALIKGVQYRTCAQHWEEAPQ